MKYFPKKVWDFTYYGTYKRPINLFAKQYQPELTTAYHDSLRRARSAALRHWLQLAAARQQPALGQAPHPPWPSKQRSTRFPAAFLP